MARDTAQIIGIEEQTQLRGYPLPVTHTLPFLLSILYLTRLPQCYAALDWVNSLYSMFSDFKSCIRVSRNK